MKPLILALLLLSARSLFASAAGGPTWTVTVGAGLLTAPAFPGSSDYQVRAWPTVRVNYGDVFFASVEEGIGYNVVNTDTWRVTPVVTVDFGREADGDNLFRIGGDKSNDLVGFADIDTTLQAGVRVSRPLGPWDATLGVQRGLNGHKGTTVELGLDQSSEVAGDGQGGPGTWMLINGPRATWGDRRYNDAYFGVSPAASAGSGLPGFRAGPGLFSAGWNVTLVGILAGNWSLTGILQYSVLLGDAEDSPLVVLRGSTNQITAGVFLSRRF